MRHKKPYSNCGFNGWLEREWYRPDHFLVRFSFCTRLNINVIELFCLCCFTRIKITEKPSGDFIFPHDVHPAWTGRQANRCSDWLRFIQKPASGWFQRLVSCFFFFCPSLNQIKFSFYILWQIELTTGTLCFVALGCSHCLLGNVDCIFIADVCPDGPTDRTEVAVALLLHTVEMMVICRPCFSISSTSQTEEWFFWIF